MNLKNICLDKQEQSSYFSNKVKYRNKKAALFWDFFFPQDSRSWKKQP